MWCVNKLSKSYKLRFMVTKLPLNLGVFNGCKYLFTYSRYFIWVWKFQAFIISYHYSVELVFSSFIVYMGILKIYIVRGEEIRHKNGEIQGIIISIEGRLDRGKDMWVS